LLLKRMSLSCRTCGHGVKTAHCCRAWCRYIECAKLLHQSCGDRAFHYDLSPHDWCPHSSMTCSPHVLDGCRLPKWFFCSRSTPEELFIVLSRTRTSSQLCANRRRGKPCRLLSSHGNRSYEHRICISPCRDRPCRWRPCRLIQRRLRHRSSVDPHRSRTCRRRSNAAYVQRLA
jgi:hypothetical protein